MLLQGGTLRDTEIYTPGALDAMELVCATVYEYWKKIQKPVFKFLMSPWRLQTGG